MASAAAIRIPRWLVITSYPVGAIVLTTIFIFVGFPYDQLSGRLAGTIESAAGVRVHIGDLSPHIGLAGPGLAASQVQRIAESGQGITLERLVVRPAWSLSWLRATPAIHLDVTSEVGSGAGVLTLGQTGGWKGNLEAVQLAHLPVEMLDLMSIKGTLDATVDLHQAATDAEATLVGTVSFELRDGSLGGTAAMPVIVPFDRLYGTLRFGDDTFMTLEEVALEGPLVEATIEGQIGHGPSPDRQPLSIDAAYTMRDPNLARKLGSIGQAGPDGRAHLTIAGTLARPVLR